MVFLEHVCQHRNSTLREIKLRSRFMEKRIQFSRRENKRNELETQFWPRAFAFAIDMFILRLLIVPMVLGIPSLFHLVPDETPQDLTNESTTHFIKVNSGIVVGVYFVVFILYGAILESSRLQGTFGKWFMRFAVCDTDIGRIAFPRALLRNTTKILSLVSVVGVFIIDMTSRRQALHDLIARTVLIKR